MIPNDYWVPVASDGCSNPTMRFYPKTNLPMTNWTKSRFHHIVRYGGPTKDTVSELKTWSADSKAGGSIHSEKGQELQ